MKKDISEIYKSPGFYKFLQKKQRKNELCVNKASNKNII